MTIDFDDIRRRYPLRDQIEAYGSKVKAGGKFRCVIPSHLDKTASANLLPNNPEKWRCHGCDRGGDVIDLVAAVEGLTTPEAARRLTGLEPTRRNPPPPREEKVGLVFRLGPVPENAPLLRARYETPRMLTRQGKLMSYVPSFVFVYRTPEGREVGRVMRIDRSASDKYFTQARWCLDRKAWVNVGWAGDDKAPLYNADELERRPGAPVLLCEGEKCVEHAKACLKDHVVTCWIGGAAAASRADFSQLAGREVTLWPDNDEPGVKAMKVALKAIKSDRLYWVEPGKDWGKGYDVADLIKDEGVGAPASWLQGRTRIERKAEATPTAHGSFLPVSQGGWFPDGGFIELTKSEDLKLTSETNTFSVVQYHPHFASLTFDAVTRQLLHSGQPITEAGMYELQRDMARLTRISPGMTKLGPIVEAVAMTRVVNGLADKLLALQWDKVHRALGDYAGVKRTHWSEAAFRVWMLGMVRRILEPGCQHDIMLVLEGPQGIQKTSFLRILGSALGFDGFAEVEKLSSSDNGMMILDSKYLIELGEMVAYRKADQEAFKKTLTSRVDRYRRPYAKRFIDIPRCSVFAGTTNRLDNYLTDSSGNRRIAPVRIESAMRLDDLERDVLQIFAEHVALFQSLKKAQKGAPINWFSRAEEAWQTEETGKREVLDVFVDELDDFLRKAGNSFTWMQCYSNLGLLDLTKRRSMQNEIKAALERRGWVQTPRGTSDSARSEGPIWRRVEKQNEHGI
jgi:putative DNA primase/helicase